MADASLTAALRLIPSGSQVFTVSLLVVGAICEFAGFAFLWHQRPGAWVPLGIGGVLLLAAIWTWSRSHRDVDLRNAPATTIRHAATGLEITSDPRALTADASRVAISRLISVMAHRARLPEPDGLVGPDGKPVSNSSDEAKARVKQANEEAESHYHQSVETLSVRGNFIAAEQMTTEISPPPIDALPPQEAVLTTQRDNIARTAEVIYREKSDDE